MKPPISTGNAPGSFRTVFSTALGTCAISWGAGGVTGFELPEAEPQRGSVPDQPRWITAIIARVRRHLAGKAQDFADVRYDFSSVTPFQRSVYKGALTVKSASTATYGQLAAKLGLPLGASRAVGGALGRNPWPLLVPCHRFVGADGRMTGFSAPGGIKTKRRLLRLEGAKLFAR